MTPARNSSEMERRVADEIRSSESEIVALASDLIRFDTTARNPEDPPRDEAALQEYLADRLREAGAVIDLWEPPPTPAKTRLLPQNMDFRGRPQMVATFRGGGGPGKSLLLNGHIDAVSPEPIDRWTSPPLEPEMRDGRLYGRGAADMKGGIASFVVAVEALRKLDVPLQGDLLVATNTDEESSGAGAYALVDRGVRADGCIVAEPTDFAAWVCCRGTVTPVIGIEGRAGHAEFRQPHWRDGGAVNAIEKLGLVLDAVRRLREEWRERPDQQHPLLPPGDLVPTIVRGGDWMVTYPASCELTVDITYLPGNVDADGTGKAVEAEVMDYLNAAAKSDPWLVEHPLNFTWECDVVPAEIPADHPLVTIARETGAELGRSVPVGGLDSWHDAAAFTRLAGIPSFSFGPGGTASMHAVDEHVPVGDLVDLSVATALIAMRWCGVRS